MNEKQRRLINYFNNLPDPTPPPAPAVDLEEGIFESLTPGGVAPPSPPQPPPKPTIDSVRAMLEKMRAAKPAGAGTVGAGGMEEIEEGIFESLPASPELLPAPTPGDRPISDDVIGVAISATEKALNDREMSLDEEDIFEALVLPGKRPVVDVIDGDITSPPPGWEFIGEHRAVIKRILPSIGRIDIPELLTAPYAGTGFFVGDGLLMTNRHVARLFVNGVGAGNKYLTFLADRTAFFDPKYEVGAAGSGASPQRFKVTQAVLVHPHWDCALLRVEPVNHLPLPPSLKLAPQAPPDFEGGELKNVLVIGYPMLDTRRNDPVEIEQQMNIFRRVFGRKRVMPGYMTGYREVPTKWNATLRATTHDASTLGGNSGSAVIDLTTGTVLSLHFGGRYLEANFGVPTWELARDPRVNELGLDFLDVPAPTPGGGPIAVTSSPEWLKTWDSVVPLVPEEAVSSNGTAVTAAVAKQNVLPIAPDWFERVSDVDLVEAMRRDPKTTEQLIRQTLLPREADDLLRDLNRALAPPPAMVTEEEGIFDFLTGGPKVDPSLPEIIFLHGIMGGHLAAYGSLGGRVWLSPLAFAAGNVAGRLTLADDGERDLTPGSVLYPDGHIRLVYEKAARKWRMRGFVVHEFTFDWRKPIANSADRLHLFLEGLRLERPAKRFALVGHSMGGLVAALYGARHPEWTSRITQSVFLGSPLRGSYAPIEAFLGTYPLFPKFALVDRTDDLMAFVSMARTLPGLIDMLPDPDVFPDAAPLYQRANWPAQNAPAQIWLDQSKQLKRLLANSPLLETARLVVSPGHATVSNISMVNGRLQSGARNRPGDGTVPTRSAAAGVQGVTTYRATYSHGDLPREPAVIEAVGDLLSHGTCQLPLLTQQEINDTTIIEESITEGIEESTVAADLDLRLRSGILTQRDVDFLLRSDRSTLPGAVGVVVA